MISLIFVNQLVNMGVDDAVKFTSEMHDPCAQESPTHEKKTRTPYRKHRCGAGQTPSEG